MNTLPHGGMFHSCAAGIRYTLKIRMRPPHRARIFAFCLLLFAVCVHSSYAAEYVWMAADRNGSYELTAAQEGMVKVSVRMPGKQK